MVEFKVVNVEFSNEIVDIGAEAAKKMPSYCRYRYYVTTRKTTEHSVVIDGQEAALTKPKLKQAIERTKQDVAAGRVLASQHDGNWYTIVRYVVSTMDFMNALAGKG